MPVLTATPHVWLDAQGRSWIDETNIKVIEVAQPHLAYGWSAETLHEQYPHLTLAQVYAALAYFYDHQEELESQIAAEEREVAALRAQTGESSLQRRLRRSKDAR